MSCASCCTQPTCAEPVIEWRAVAASCQTTGCGDVNPAENTGTKYLVVTTTTEHGYTTTITYSRNPESNECQSVTTCSGESTWTFRREARGSTETIDREEYLITEYGPPYNSWSPKTTGHDTVEDSFLEYTSTSTPSEDCSEFVETCTGSSSRGNSSQRSYSYPTSNFSEASETYFSYHCEGTYALVLQPPPPPPEEPEENPVIPPDVFACEWRYESTQEDSENPEFNGTYEGSGDCFPSSGGIFSPGAWDYLDITLDTGVVGPNWNESVTTYASPESLTGCELEFPDYPDWDQTGTLPAGVTKGEALSTPLASRSFSDDMMDKSALKLQWRIKHPPTGTCYLKVWLESVFTPEPTPEEPSPAEVVTPLAPYIWTGAPCVPDDTKSVADLANMIKGAETDLELTVDGNTLIRIVKYSCVDGYTPADGDYPPFPPEASP